MTMTAAAVLRSVGGVLAQITDGIEPLPAEPPIGGAVWTIVIPTLLFVGSFLGTYLLYKRFSREEETEA